MNFNKERRKSLMVAGTISTTGISILDPMHRSLTEEPVPDNTTDLPVSDLTHIEARNDLNTCADYKQQKPKMISTPRKVVNLFSGYFFIFLAHGFPFQLSVIYVDLLEDFQESRAMTSSIISVCMGVFYISGILSGLLIKRCGVRWAGIIGGVVVSASISVSSFAASVIYLIISIGICSGIGFSVLYINSSACVAPHFKDRSLNLALLSLSFASGAGWMAFPYIFEYLIDQYTWRGTFLIIGGICLNCIPASLLLVRNNLTESGRRLVETKQEKSSLKENVTDKLQQASPKQKTVSFDRIVRNVHIIPKDLKNFEFWTYALGLSISLSTLNAYKLSIIDFYEFKNLSRSDSVLIFFIMNVSGTVGRIIPIIMKHIPHIGILFVNSLMAALGSVALAMLVISSSFLEITAASCCFGVSLGCILTMIPLTVYKLIHIHRYEVGIGIAMTLTGIGIVIAGPVSGYLQDVSGSFDISLYSASAIMICAAICFLVAEAARKYRHKKDKKLVLSGE